jgi:hypothetical protein
MGLLSNVFSQGYRAQIETLQAENIKLRVCIAYEKTLAEERVDAVAELREQIKQLKSVLETCAQVLDSAAKS